MNLHAWKIGTTSGLMNQLLAWSLTEYNGKCLKLGRATRYLVDLLFTGIEFSSQREKMVVPNASSDLIISQGLLSIFHTGFVFIPKGIFFSIKTETEKACQHCMSKWKRRH